MREEEKTTKPTGKEKTKGEIETKQFQTERKGRKKIPCNNSRPATLRKHSYSPATYSNKSDKGKVSTTTEMRRRQRKDIKKNLLSLSVASRALPFPSFAFVASACTILRASSRSPRATTNAHKMQKKGSKGKVQPKGYKAALN